MKNEHIKELKKKIVDSLYKPNFYEATINIKELEKTSSSKESSLYFNYFLYDLIEWVSNHQKKTSLNLIQEKKEHYFNELIEFNKNQKSKTYIELYKFLEENFRTFDHYSWFNKYEKSKYFLNNALKEEPNSLDAKFYLFFCEYKMKDCIDFLLTNDVKIELVHVLIKEVWYKDEFVDDIEEIRKKYKLNSEKTKFDYHDRKKNYKWLYDYFIENDERKTTSNSISFGKVCYKLGKYKESIVYYENKKDKEISEFFTLGKCYEKENKKDKAIDSFKNTNHNSPYFKESIEKLFELKAYDEIDYIIKNENFTLYKEYKIFYESRLLNIKKLYLESINCLNGIFDTLHNHHNDLKKDIYFLYIKNNYHLINKYIKDKYIEIINENSFEHINTLFNGLNYRRTSSFKELEKYIKKFNIEYNNKFKEKTDFYSNNIDKLFLLKIKKLYKKSKEVNYKLSEDIELYYLSAFDDLASIDKRLSFFKNRIKKEIENPIHYLEVGSLYYQRAILTNTNFEVSVKYLEKSIELADKYFIDLHGEAELLLVKIKSSNKEKKELFDKSLNDFIFFNSYQKDVQTRYFIDTLYKYQSFSINTLSSLSDKYFYFASPDKLNDPFDVASETLEGQFENLKLNKSDFKLCSLSKINSNKLMWSHYTSEHTGICVGYKFLYLPNYVGKEEVEYKNMALDEKVIFDSILKYWTVKSEDWEYEKEVRLLHYGEKDKIFYTFDVSEAMNKNIIALEIESITFGSKFKNESILRPIIKELEEEQNKKITIYKANKSKQNLILEQIKEE
ncbi:DUF2971 domain-containing protein [Poseidonibacter lekithochrous]|uniref:DUF2971 domain-containing protein n=1 Tax=Poseidonibacter lekithochrous TaxID=1904463 RepID=UPI0013DBDDAB|nr:DUF2971 domain-containing protein [Poseidonibacter lekithochrous]